MRKYELFGTAGCPYTGEMRDWLEWQGYEYAEHDVEADPAARARMLDLSNGQRSVPLLVENGKVVQIGWQGHACFI